jgi:lysophospholipase L1-like esterase
VFGYGVKQEETLGDRLADTLRKEGLPAEVINSGVPAYSIDEEIGFLALDGIRYHPDYVILGFCWNDLTDNRGIRVSREGWLVSADEGDRSPSYPLQETPATYRLRNLLKRSRIAYAAMTGLRSVQENLWPDSHYLFRNSVLEGLQTQSLGQDWKRVAQNVRRLQELSVQHGFRVLVVAFPLPLALEADFPRSSYPKSLADIAAREGVPFLDLQDIFRRAYRGHDSLFIPYDADHPNGVGHALAASSIRDYLEKNGGLALLISSVRHRPSFPATPR